MNKYNYRFSRQLIIYMVVVLFITFGFISINLFITLKLLLNTNARHHTKNISTNIIQTIYHEISRFEALPVMISELCDDLDYQHAKVILRKIVEDYPFVEGCSIHYDITHPLSGKIPHLRIYKQENDSIVCETPLTYNVHISDSSISKNSRNGYWIQTISRRHHIQSYCEPLLDRNKNVYGILKIDCDLSAIANSYKLYNFGYLFIIDNKGQFITHPNPEVMAYGDINYYFNHTKPNHSKILINKFINGDECFAIITKNNIKHYLHFISIAKINWRLGVIYPCKDMSVPFNSLYILLFICLISGLLFLYGCIIRIVHKLSYPLNELSETAQKMARGEFQTQLTELSQSRQTPDEIKELYKSVHYLQKSIIDYIERLKISSAEKERINSEMRLAQKIQEQFLPAQQYIPSSVDIFGKIRQSNEVGGDLYEYFIVNDKLYFTIGDVCGKGTPSALYMASIIKFFKYVANGKTSTAEICNIINAHTCGDNDNEMYVTMFMGIIELNSGKMTYTNAGHPYPLIIEKDENVHCLSKYPDVPIGVLEDYTYKEHTYTFPRDTQILLYTDGVTDAESVDTEFYGKERLILCIKKAPEKTPEHIVNSILESISQHIRGVRQSDDLTLLAILYKGTTEEKTPD